MDTFTLHNCLRQLLCKCSFNRYYVLAKDEIGRINFKDSAGFCAIINTEILSIKTRGHWTTLIRCPNERGYIFFESYGGTPMDYNIKFPKEVLGNLTVISRPYQSNHSSVCGLYCLQLCVLLSRGYTYNYFLNLYNIYDKVGNDERVVQFYRHAKVKSGPRGGQICCSKVMNCSHG